MRKATGSWPRLAADLVDHHLERGHRLQRAEAAHRAGRDGARMARHRLDVDLGHVVDPDRRHRAHKGDRRRQVGEAAAVEFLLGHECLDPAGRLVDCYPAAHADGVALDAELKLLKTIVGKAHRAARREQAGERRVERVDAVVLAAKSTAQIGAMRHDLLDRMICGILRHQRHYARGSLPRRLDADHQFELARRAVVPGETGLRLHENLVDGLGLKFSIEHDAAGTTCVDLSADLIAIVGGPGGVRTDRRRHGPARTVVLLVERGKGPSSEHR